MGWRNNKLFVYGWFPVRLVASAVGHVALAIAVAAVYLMWFDFRDARSLWRQR
jgi:hypothetical protein